MDTREKRMQQGRQAAEQWTEGGSISTWQTSRELRASLSVIEGCHRRISHRAGELDTLPENVRWLLDNWYLARREGFAALSDWKAHRRRLPALIIPGRFPRILALARCLLQDCPNLKQGDVVPWLAGVQQLFPLTESELNLLPAAIKTTLTEQLEALCRQAEASLDAPSPDETEQAPEIAEIFTTLRTLETSQLPRWLEEANLLDGILRKDAWYPQMDEDSRWRYRQQVSTLARRSGKDELSVASEALSLAEQNNRHVGWYLFCQPLGKKRTSNRGEWYLALNLFPTLLISLGLALALGSPWGTLLLLLPVFEVVKNLLDFILLRLTPHRPVFRLALDRGVPPEGRTLCVIAALLTGSDSGPRLARLLEEYRLANRDAGEEVYYGILADLPDSRLPLGEKGRAWTESARAAVEDLNRRYGGGFYLFFREPGFQESDQRYMGWERKRGAILELTDLLKGRPVSLRPLCGNPSPLRAVRFIITLDSDTSLNVGAARKLIGAMLHPLNRPVIDRQRGIVTQGYGLLQPRVEPELDAAFRSRFARIFAGLGGVDPYGSTTCDLYHDLFDCASFTGKGILDVDAWWSCLSRRFPEQQVLSHDLLEGSYVRAGLLSQVELTDGFPWRARAYYARMHRWIRGDWQTAPWLFPKVKNQDGQWVKNPISLMSRWKIFDNLRRSLTPAAILLALMLGLCLPGRSFTVAAGAALLALISQLLLAGAETLLGWRMGRSLRYHSTVSAGLRGALSLTGTRLLLLPVEAAVCLSGAVTALWRTLITHRRRLEWAPASGVDSQKDGLPRYLRTMWFAWPVGLTVLLLGRSLPAWIMGLLWLASPLLAWYLSRPVQAAPPLPTADRAFLLYQSGLIWRYFADWLRPEDHYLIPDNVQSMPATGPARRTSPTNIGLSLLSCLAAADLELISPSRAYFLIGEILSSVERLEKWQGNLYNWYDTETCAVMSPRYVSSVDSGNLCACLLALSAGLAEKGQAELARQADRLAAETKLSALYDPQRRLFYIGWDAQQGEFPKSWYDLMASEARLLSYVSVARGDVEPRHWQALSRVLSSWRGYRGMVSWSGTMFEYFMPHLLLPCYPNSLLYESLAFCLCVQMERGSRTGTPWGISESAFCRFDAAMNYQYKAHGVQALGLKQDLDHDLVVAPYASFLALLLTPRRAVSNLRRLRAMGLEGKYGLYEAVDYTAGGGEAPFLSVNIWMAHHLGMSLVAADNALADNVMQRRFLSHTPMAAYRELLQEKIPVGATVLPTRQRNGRRRSPAARKGWSWEGWGLDPDSPVCGLLSNGSWDSFLTAGGDGWSQTGRCRLTGAVRYEIHADGQRIPLFPRVSGGDELSWQLSGSAALLRLRGMDWDAALSVSLSPDGPAELRRLELNWRGTASDARLICYLRPVLAPWGEYQSHPAFSRLRVESRFIGNGVLFHRRGGRDIPQLAALWDGSDVSWDTSRPRFWGYDATEAAPAGAVLDPCLGLTLPLISGRNTLSLALAAGSAEECVPLAQGLLSVRALPALSLLDREAVRLGLDARQIQEAFALLSRLAFPAPAGMLSPPRGQAALWPYGISGDFPLIVCRVSPDSVEQAVTLACQQELLLRCGYVCDLALLLPEQGDYDRPTFSPLATQLNKLGLHRRRWLLQGAEPDWEPLLGMADVVLSAGERLEQGCHFSCPPPHSVFLPPARSFLPGNR